MPTALVTGANRGIGLQLCRQYAERGWTAIGTARRPDEADELRAIDGAEVIALDVASEQSLATFADLLGERPVDHLICNAGIGDWKEPDRATFTNVLAVNTVGAALTARRLKPNLLAGGERKLAVVSSGVGSITNTDQPGGIAYRTSKAAVNMAFKAMALEWRDEGIAVVCLNPGWVQTDMGGPNATITTKESAQGILERMDELTVETTGRFVNWKGEELPW